MDDDTNSEERGLEAWRVRDDYEREVELLRAQVKRLADALRPILEQARRTNDTGGPSGECWQSERLVAQIAAADAALTEVGR